MKFLMCRLGVTIGSMNVASRCFEGFVTEENLDGGGVCATFGEVGSKTVTQTVGACFDTDAEVLAVPFNFHLEVVRTDVFLFIAGI